MVFAFFLLFAIPRLSHWLCSKKRYKNQRFSMFLQFSYFLPSPAFAFGSAPKNVTKMDDFHCFCKFLTFCLPPPWPLALLPKTLQTSMVVCMFL
jgi:hypothetical protein